MTIEDDIIRRTPLTLQPQGSTAPNGTGTGEAI